MKGIRERKTKNGKSKYEVQVRVKGAKPITKTFERLTDAKRYKAAVETDIRRGNYFPEDAVKKRTLAELIDKYLKETTPHRRSKQAPVQTLLWWKKQIGFMTLDKVTTKVIKNRWDALAKTPSEATGKLRANRTMNGYLETLSAMFNKAYKEYEWVPANPVEKIKRTPLNNQRTRHLSQDEAHRLLKAIKNSPNDYLLPAVLLSLATGKRLSSVMTLKWEHVNLDTGDIVFLNTKNKAHYSSTISGAALTALKKHALKYQHNEYIFAARKPKWKQGNAKKSLPYEQLKKPFQRALDEACIENFRWHDLRHSTASFLIATGCTLAQVGQVLGHKSPQSTWRYSHLIKEQGKELIENVDKQFLQG